MPRATAFAAALVLTPSLQRDVAVVHVRSVESSGVTQDVAALYQGSNRATVMPVGQSWLIVIGDPTVAEEISTLVRPLCP